MNILVYVRPYPGWDKLRFNLSHGAVEVPADVPTGLSAFGEGSWTLNPSDWAALDWAGRLAGGDASGSTRITAIALAAEPVEAAEAALREAVARGADRAILVAGAGEPDSFLTANILTALVRRASAAGAYDLLLAGAATPSGGPDEVAAMVAEDMGWSLLGEVSELVAGAAGRLRGRTESATLEAALPAVATVMVAAGPAPRYAHAGAIIAAFRQAGLASISLAELGLAGPAVAEDTARVRVRRAVLGETGTSERLAGPVDESVAVLVPALRQILS